MWFLDTSRWLATVLSVAIYGLICLLAWRAALCQRRAPQQPVGVEAWQLVFASQTGNAEAIAMQSAQALMQAGVAVCCYPLNQLDARRLREGGRFLFVVSTAGDGEPPDNALRFVRDCLAEPLDLKRLDYGLLALGDRNYARFNAFGRRLDSWLQASGARRSFDPIELDRCEPAGLAHWRQQMTRLAGAAEWPEWAVADFSSWRLVDRKFLNPGSPGRPVYRLSFAPLAAAPHWESGDLAQICVPADPEQPREYSIASLPAEGALQLLVRQHVRADGSEGLASSYLCQNLPLGENVSLRVRPHPGFRLTGNLERPLILIANGVGLAGVRGHLAARIARQRADNWLIFGERCGQTDRFCRDEIDAWRVTGKLQRLDQVFSRDGARLRYVQDVVQSASEELLAWIARGAAIYVCGSRRGMGESVDRVLRDILGQACLDQLFDEGRYRRDVF